jgi:hypothetical protein
VNDPSLDADTAERTLRGEATGSPELAALLAAASSGLAAQDPKGEEAAVAAFREASRVRQPNARRLSALLSLKAALVGLLLALTGGVAVAATTHHLPGPLGHRRPGGGRTPATSQTFGTPSAPRASARPTQGRDGPQATHPKNAEKKSHHKKTKKPKKTKKNTVDGVASSVPVPSTSLRVDATPGLVSPTG